MYDSVRWIRKASSSSGWARSSEWQWLSTIGMASKSSVTGRCGSVLEEVVVELERFVLLGVGRGLGSADLQVFGRETASEGSHQDVVALQLVEGFARARREAPDPALLPLGIREIAGVLVDRLARIEATGDAVEGS